MFAKCRLDVVVHGNLNDWWHVLEIVSSGTAMVMDIVVCVVASATCLIYQLAGQNNQIKRQLTSTGPRCRPHRDCTEVLGE